MLHPVCRHPSLCTAHADERALRNIIIHAIDIRIGVVNNVMLELPDKTITTQRVKCKTKQVVHLLIRGIAAMVGIVHYIKPDASHCKTKRATKQYVHPYRQRKEQY